MRFKTNNICVNKKIIVKNTRGSKTFEVMYIWFYDDSNLSKLSFLNIFSICVMYQNISDKFSRNNL